MTDTLRVGMIHASHSRYDEFHDSIGRVETKQPS